MARKNSMEKANKEKVVFKIEAADAKEVYLLGDFNRWNPRKHPMKREGQNRWVASVSLPEGQYQYKFLVDGQWVEDPLNDQVCQNCFGTHNNLFNVSLK
jgi:1,4-alpha-glucan branching enzyme